MYSSRYFADRYFSRKYFPDFVGEFNESSIIKYASINCLKISKIEISAQIIKIKELDMRRLKARSPTIKI